MSFQGTDQAYRLFQRADFGQPVTLPPKAPEPTKALRTPGFLVRRESSFGSSFSSLKALFTRSKFVGSPATRYIYRDASLTGFKAPGIGLFESLVLHCGAIFAILFLPALLPQKPPRLAAQFLPPEVIYYPVPERHTEVHLPKIAPRGPGGHPGSGNHPTLPPDVGKTVSNRNLTAISKPLRPDNVHQTIIQPATPPELRIPNDVKVPNLSLGAIAQPKKPTFDMSMKKPATEAAKLAPDMATPVAETNFDSTFHTSLQATNMQPKMPIPAGAMARPTRRDGSTDGTVGSEMPEIGAAGDGRAILAIGISPSEGAFGVALPPGNRYGDFAIAPGGEGSGSPGGKAKGAAGGGGSGGSGRAGDESVGLGPGKEGGGGGKDGSASRLSINGTGSSIGGVATLDSRVEARMVYPVLASALNVPKSRMVVSAGGVGGGGLGVYNVLPCSKIYTIFLPMNGWSMQYCEKLATGAPAEAPKVDPKSAVIQMQAGIIPPDPDLSARYDFQRLPVPPGKGEKQIVLRGVLKDDGTIDALEVYQGVVPAMDEAARIAFSRWKFKPAMKSGKAIALDFLVGIPPAAARSGNPQ